MPESFAFDKIQSFANEKGSQKPCLASSRDWWFYNSKDRIYHFLCQRITVTFQNMSDKFVLCYIYRKKFSIMGDQHVGYSLLMPSSPRLFYLIFSQSFPNVFPIYLVNEHCCFKSLGGARGITIRELWRHTNRCKMFIQFLKVS